jgi:hypothetical protein
MRIFRPLIVLTALLAVGAAEAEVGAYHAIGAGNKSCGSWSAHRHEYNPGGRPTAGTQASTEDASWVVGFLSGIGFVGEKGDDPLNGVDADGVWAWIDNYCRAHPIESIARAASAFYFAHPHR